MPLVSARGYTPVILHDLPLNVAGTGSVAHRQPENIVDFSSASDSGLRFHLTAGVADDDGVPQIVGTADSWKLKCKFQLGAWDERWATFSEVTWTDLDEAQIANLILEGVDWYAGEPPPATETNPFPRPRMIDTTGLTASLNASGAGDGAASGSLQSGEGFQGANAFRMTYTGNSTVYGGGIIVGAAGAVHVTPGELGTFSWYVMCSKRQRLRTKVTYYDVSNTQIGTASGVTTVVEANTLTRLTVTATAPAGTSYVNLRTYNISGTDSSLWLTGDWIEGSAPFYNPGTNTRPYFDGEFPDTAEVTYSWTGTPDASPSLKSTLVTSEDNVVARNTDDLPLRCSRAIKGFGRLVCVWLWLEASGASSDFAVNISLTVD